MDNNWNNWNNWNNYNGEPEAPNDNPEKPVDEQIATQLEESFTEPVEDTVATIEEAVVTPVAEPVVEAFTEPVVETVAEAVAAPVEDAVASPIFNEPPQQIIYHPDIPSQSAVPANNWNAGYGNAAGNTYSAAGYGGDTGNTYGAAGYGARDNTSNRSKKAPGYVTRKGLAIALILTMLATSGLTIGGLALGGAFDKRISAYNNNTIPVTQTSGGTASQLSIQEIAAINENAVVEIQTEKLVTDFWLQNYITQGAGSGVIIDSDGYILTCNHVIEDARSITVTTKNGARYDATVIGADELTDIAVLKIKGSNFTTVTYGDSSALSIGDLAVVMGNPLGQLGGSISSGIISALDRSVVVEGKAMTLIQTDASINPGNSGGGLFDGSGRLVGLVVAKAGDTSSNVEGIGFAVPINQAAIIADQLIEYGKVRRPLIGVMIVDVTTEAAAKQFGVDELGLYIDEVAGDNAKAAGFQKGDIIKAVNGNPIRNKNDLTVEINRNQVGDKVTITVSRDGELIDIETVLQDSEL